MQGAAYHKSMKEGRFERIAAEGIERAARIKNEALEEKLRLQKSFEELLFELAALEGLAQKTRAA